MAPPNQRRPSESVYRPVESFLGVVMVVEDFDTLEVDVIYIVFFLKERMVQEREYRR